MAAILGGYKLNEYINEKKKNEAFNTSSTTTTNSMGGIIGGSIFIILFLIVWIWSMILAFRCNKNPEDAIQQFVYVLIMTTLLPFISNIIYIYYKKSYLC